jgi:hypothetical protein
VSAGTQTFHETQSKLIIISGTGFPYPADIKISIRPTYPDAYKIVVFENTLHFQLKQGKSWLPSFLTLKGEDESRKIPLQVASIDTGAGEITFDNPITVGFIVKDREGFTCDDSCEFAFDGVCDEGTSNESSVSDDGFLAQDSSACVKGTDCTDCGGVDAMTSISKAPVPDSNNIESCVNTCAYARDGVCDDPRGANYCKLGTDCQDCGPVGADNFTRIDNDDIKYQTYINNENLLGATISRLFSIDTHAITHSHM